MEPAGAAETSLSESELVRPGSRAARWTRFAAAALLLFGFLVGVRGLCCGFMLFGDDLVGSFFAATSNPFVGLAIGILGTAIVQSSGATTAMVVALVAAPEDPLPIANAVPMVMGANIGTTVTAKLVSLGQVGNPVQFRRAFAASSCHDCFNLLATGLLLPLELLTGYLEKTSGVLVAVIPRGVTADLPDPVKVAADFVLVPVRDVVMALAPSQVVGATVMVLLAAALIVGSLVGLIRSLGKIASGRLEKCVANALDERPVTGMAVGAAATVMVQSSSITTSLLIPFAATRIVTLEQAFPIVLGTNVGSTVTALIASMGAPPETFHLGVQISLVHLMFNLTGIILIFPVRRIRQIPLNMARKMGEIASRSSLIPVFIVLFLFFLLPGALTFLYQVLR
jgi:sodium-dependent phosphate cotransporter